MFYGRAATAPPFPLVRRGLSGILQVKRLSAMNSAAIHVERMQRNIMDKEDVCLAPIRIGRSQLYGIYGLESEWQETQERHSQNARRSGLVRKSGPTNHRRWNSANSRNRPNQPSAAASRSFSTTRTASRSRWLFTTSSQPADSPQLFLEPSAT